MSSSENAFAAIQENASRRAVSGMRPTGALHLGHYFGAIKNWVAMQETMQTFFFVADWHALTSEYENPLRIREFVPELVKDWLVAGLDPERSVMFQQSHVKEHAELHLIMSMVTPVSWLERCRGVTPSSPIEIMNWLMIEAPAEVPAMTAPRW